MLATTTTRSQGSPEVHRKFEQQAEKRLEWLASRPHLIAQRLRELDEEWDIERAIEANAATLALTGTVLSMTHDRRWAYLPLVVTGFLLQHATQGWCPPVPILRALGFRTQGEIERERYALKALRGDFDDLPGNSRSDQRRAEQHSTQHTDGSVRLSGSYQRRDPSFDTHGEGYDQGRRKGGEIHVGSIPRPGSDNLSHGKFKSAPL